MPEIASTNSNTIRDGTISHFSEFMMTDVGTRSLGWSGKDAQAEQSEITIAHAATVVARIVVALKNACRRAGLIAGMPQQPYTLC